MNGLLTGGIVGAVGYLAMCGLLYFRQDSYVYFPDSRIRNVPSDFGMKYEDVRIPVGNGRSIHAWYVPARDGTNQAPSLLFCHGNAGNIGDRCGSLLTFNRMGFNVLIFDYEGYGLSDGRPSEDATYRDARAAWEYLTVSRGADPSGTVVFGRSLGGAVGVHLAAVSKPAALIVESSFTSLPDMGARLYRFLPVRLLARYRYDSVAGLKAVSCPVLVAHSRDDEMIPFEHGRRLFDAAKGPKVFVEMRGGHNETGLDGDADYRAAFLEFVQASVAKGTGQ